MAEENMENYEVQDEQPSKKKLIFSLIAFILVVALLIMGIVLFFVLEDIKRGQISVDGHNVNITANARVEGMSEPMTLPEIVIDENTEEVESWEVNLVFENADSIITIYIVVTNNNQENTLHLSYNNATSPTSLTIQNYYYIGEDSSSQAEIPGQHSVYLDAGETITYISTYKIADANNSISNALDIRIDCSDIEM